MISLALLMGGHGHRLGGIDKARLVLPNGLTAGENVLATFRPHVADVFAVGRVDQLNHPLSRTIRLITDAEPGQGPLRAIGTALAATSTPWVFVVACDLVGLTASDLTALASERSRGRLAIGWRSPSGAEPLCALYHRGLAGTASHLLAGGERRARRLLERAYLLTRATDLENINTPDDLTKARARSVEP